MAAVQGGEAEDLYGIALFEKAFRTSTIGGATHQFRDADEGMRGVLSIDFPLLTPGAVLSGHKLHLAIDFSNWIEAPSASLG